MGIAQLVVYVAGSGGASSENSPGPFQQGHENVCQVLVTKVKFEN